MLSENTNKKTIISGNQNVLIARLEDAMFFYQKDLSENLQNTLLSVHIIHYYLPFYTSVALLNHPKKNFSCSGLAVIKST